MIASCILIACNIWLLEKKVLNVQITDNIHVIDIQCMKLIIKCEVMSTEK